MIDNAGINCEAAPVCGLCGSSGAVLHVGLADHLFGAPGQWGIRQCRNADCAAGWVDPAPVPQDIGKLYQSYYTHAQDGETDERAAAGGGATASRRATLKRLLARLLPWQSAQFASGLLYLEDKTPGRLLEVGCGSGWFLREAMQRGWQAEGIDFDQQAIAAANRLQGVTARVGDLDHPDLLAGSYHAIVMNHVIEHVPYPVQAFSRCAALLQPGGRLVMVTPNMEAQGHRLFGPDWRGLEIPRHLHLFTARSLRQLARSAGFSRVQAFSPIGGHETQYMIRQSEDIARKAGRQPPRANASRMRVTASLAALFGAARGEFLALVAER